MTILFISGLLQKIFHASWPMIVFNIDVVFYIDRNIYRSLHRKRTFPPACPCKGEVLIITFMEVTQDLCNKLPKCDINTKLIMLMIINNDDDIAKRSSYKLYSFIKINTCSLSQKSINKGNYDCLMFIPLLSKRWRDATSQGVEVKYLFNQNHNSSWFYPIVYRLIRVVFLNILS